jgi:hypothetical protein
MLAAQAAREKAVELALAGRDAPFPRAAPDDVIVTDLVRANESEHHLCRAARP